MVGSYDCYTLEDVKSLIEISNSSIGGIILYDLTHANVSKVLQDRNYWDCFDKLSGPNWPILATVRPLPTNNMYFTECMIGFKNTPEPDDELLDALHINRYSETPCFVLMAWDDKDELHCWHHSIADTSVSDAYNSIREIICVIAEAESKILEENKKTFNVFVQSEIQLKGFSKRKQIKNIPLSLVVNAVRLILA